MADVVVFETDLSVSEVLDYTLSCYGIGHQTILAVCQGQVPEVGYFRAILAEHQPKIVLTSYRHIWPVIREAVNDMWPRPQLWVFTGCDVETIDRQGMQRVFRKPYYVSRMAEELQSELGLSQGVSP